MHFVLKLQYPKATQKLSVLGLTLVIPCGPSSRDEVGSTLVTRLQIFNPILFIVTMKVAMIENGNNVVGQPSANHNPFAD